MSYDDIPFAEELVETSMQESVRHDDGHRRQPELAASLETLFSMFGGQVVRPVDGRL